MVETTAQTKVRNYCSIAETTAQTKVGINGSRFLRKMRISPNFPELDERSPKQVLRLFLTSLELVIGV
jgi:hypothetical protein